MFGHRQVGAAAEKADLDHRGHVATPFAGSSTVGVGAG
jgi:hypothetical protein